VVLISVITGWTVGYTKGVINGYDHAQAEGLSEYPIANVYFFKTGNEEEFLFTDMATGKHITKGTFEDCIEIVNSGDADRKVVFSRGDEDEQ
jgi:hypothetical protein